MKALAEATGRPHGRAVSAILATADEPFRNRVLERLLAAGYDDLEVAELPAALADLLRETKQTLVIVGGTWPDPQAFLRVAVNAGALPLVLLESSALEAEGEALAMGARAALQSDIPASSLAAALAAALRALCGHLAVRFTAKWPSFGRARRGHAIVATGR